MTQEISIKYTKQLIDAINRLARAKENENRIEAVKWLYTYRTAYDSTDESYIKLMADVCGIDIVEEAEQWNEEHTKEKGEDDE